MNYKHTKLLAKFLLFSLLFVFNYCFGVIPAIASLAVSNNEVVDMQPYMRNVQRLIKSNWQPPRSDSSAQIVLLFKIDRQGKVLSSEILHSSGDSSLDESALAALNLSDPLPPLPERFVGDSVSISFTFDYNLIGAEKNSKLQKNMFEKKSSGAYLKYRNLIHIIVYVISLLLFLYFRFIKKHLDFYMTNKLNDNKSLSDNSKHRHKL